MSHYYKVQIDGQEYGIALSVPAEPNEEYDQARIDLLHMVIRGTSIPERIQRVQQRNPDAQLERWWIEDESGNLIEEGKPEDLIKEVENDTGPE